MTYAYYNEIDPYAAAWLRNLISAGHIAPGVVDERSIEDVQPDDLREFKQCHFFAGVGVWSRALRGARWPDDRAVWTGSCPCQPFSAAGKGHGFADERHLWPAFFHLIKECRPPVVFGEQVASKVIDAWIDLVQVDVEAVDYSFGAVPFPSAGVGSPHIRDRLYWVAHAEGERWHRRQDSTRTRGWVGFETGGVAERLADNNQHGRIAVPIPGLHYPESHTESCSHSVGLGDAGSTGLEGGERFGSILGFPSRASARETTERTGVHDAKRADDSRPGPTNGIWRDADWLGCRDGKWRPVRPGAFPLVNGAPARVGRLRAYGNAINAEAARVFIEATNL